MRLSAALVPDYHHFRNYSNGMDAYDKNQYRSIDTGQTVPIWWPSDAHPMDTYDRTTTTRKCYVRAHPFALDTDATAKKGAQRHQTSPTKHQNADNKQPIICIMAFYVEFLFSLFELVGGLVVFRSFPSLYTPRICASPGSLGTHSVPCNGTHKGKIIGSSYDRLAPRICA